MVRGDMARPAPPAGRVPLRCRSKSSHAARGAASQPPSSLRRGADSTRPHHLPPPAEIRRRPIRPPVRRERAISRLKRAQPASRSSLILALIGGVFGIFGAITVLFVGSVAGVAGRERRGLAALAGILGAVLPRHLDCLPRVRVGRVGPPAVGMDPRHHSLRPSRSSSGCSSSLAATSERSSASRLRATFTHHLFQPDIDLSLRPHDHLISGTHRDVGLV